MTILATASGGQGQGAHFSLPLIGTVSGGGVLLVLGLIVWAISSGREGGHDGLGRDVRRALRGGDKSAGTEAIEAFFRVLGRFLAGRPLSGRKTTATFTKPAERVAKHDETLPVAALGSIALPAPVALDKHPHPTPPAWVATVTGYDGPGAKKARAAGRATLQGGKGVGRVLRAAVRGLGSYSRWRGAAVLTARLTVLGLAAGFAVPAWRGRTIALVVVAAALVVVYGIIGPHGLGVWKGRPRGDDEKLGPGLWAVLREELDLPEGTRMDAWVDIPLDVSADDARVTVRLPLGYGGGPTDQARMTGLMDTRLPRPRGWTGKFVLHGDRPTAVFRATPPPPRPRPVPEPPAEVSLWDPEIQTAIMEPGVNRIVLGVDADGQVLTRSLDIESPHMAYSIGTGGGKSTHVRCAIVPACLVNAGTFVIIDMKRVSALPLLAAGLPNVHAYTDPNNPEVIRAVISWVKGITDARYYEFSTGKRKTFPPLFVNLEECNELRDILKEHWDEIRSTSDPASDPIWKDIASIMRLGREANVHLFGFFQDLENNSWGTVRLRNLFSLKVMGNYDEEQWKKIIGRGMKAPASQDKSGRMVLYVDGKVRWFQSATAHPEELTAYYKALYGRFGHSTVGLYGDPPAPGVPAVPHMLRASLSRLDDEDAQPGEDGASSQVDSVTSGDVTAAVTASVTPPRDAPDDDARLLSDIAKTLHEQGVIGSVDTPRQHKRRRADFPAPVRVEGRREYYSESAVLAYYRADDDVMDVEVIEDDGPEE